MSVLREEGLGGNGGVKRNSYYDMKRPYSQRDLDDYRISEGYSRDVKIYFNTKKRSEGNEA